MKIAESRPYGDAFASQIASSSEPISTTGAIGPNVSSVCDERRRRARRRAPSAASRGRSGSRPARSPPAHDRRAPRSSASPTCSSIFSATPALFSGPIVVPSANGSPRTTRSARARGKPRDELLAHGSVDEQSLARGAALSGAQEARRHRRFRGELEVGVVHHDDRPVAAELEHGRLARRGLGDLATGLGRADEADAVRAGIARDLVADDGARAGDEVEDAGQAGRPRRRTRRARRRRPPSTTRASRRPCCRRRARARSARPASCTASSRA